MVNKQKRQILDTHLFRQEMKDVTPLKTSLSLESRPPPAQYRDRRQQTTGENFTQPCLPSSAMQTHIDSDDGSSHRKNGVQKSMMQKLKRGRFAIGEQLDLHHMTIEKGHIALLEFIADARYRAFECVRVIHGKGLHSENGPRLRGMVRQVLRDHPQVLAFTASKPANGGAGAMDVLLRAK